MKKRNAVFLLIAIVLILAAGIPVYEGLYGNKWETKKETVNHLQQKYDKSFVIDSITFQSGTGTGTYYMEAHPKDNADERFTIHYDRSMKTYYDDYELAHVVYKELKPLKSMDVYYSYDSGGSPDLVEETLRENGYSEVTFNLSFYITDQEQQNTIIEAIEKINNVYKEKLNPHAAYLSIHIPNKSIIQVKNNGQTLTDLLAFWDKHEKDFRLYCHDCEQGKKCW
ncbi:hypothetical protein ACFQPF_05270 [Fictibacillus iocasae]|uniref:DUF3139 domain-containing protein n=1 Tax=Fictibacillus iocasae TaxID=2715437 RepID=A0ABW2NSR1_9BACL